MRTARAVIVLASAIAVHALVATDASAQQPMRIGLGGVVAGSAGWASSSIPVIQGSDECGSFESGRSVSASAGLSLLLERIFGGVGLGATIAFETATTTLETPPPVPTRIVDEASGDLVELDRFYRREVAERRVMLEALARIDVASRTRVAIGPSVAVAIGGSTEQSDNVTGPGRYRFADGQSSLTMASAHASESAPLAVSLVLELAHGLPLGVLDVEPFVRARADLASRTSEGGLRSIDLGAGVRVHVDITPVDVPVVIAAPPRATLAIHGLDAAGVRQATPVITMYENVTQQHIPLVPAIFFERGAASLAPRYVEPSHGGREAILAIQHSVLDTVAARLKAHAGARIELRASTSADETASVGGARLETVRQHLIERLGVDGDRVVVRADGGQLERSSETSVDGREDNRRVELASTDPTILAPVIVRSETRRFDPPAIELVPTIDAPAGVLEWNITLAHDESEVARFTSRDTTPGHPVWAVVGSPADGGAGELVARLDVTDSAGVTATATARTSMRLARQTSTHDEGVRTVGDEEQSRHLLVAFAFDRAEPGALNEARIASIAAGIRPGARVRIVGAADRIGEQQHNAELARRRADVVAAMLRTHLATRELDALVTVATAAAEQTARFANDTPEGRFLSRGVEIIIEQAR